MLVFQLNRMKSERGALPFETHLSTESPAPRQNARLSHSHEDSWGSQCLAAPPREGPSSPDSLKSSFDLSSIPQDFPAAAPKRVSAGLRRRATPERVAMYGVHPFQRSGALSTGDYGSGAPGECCAAQSLEAAGARSVSFAPHEPAGRLGLSGESSPRCGESLLGGAPAGTAALISQPASAHGAARGSVKSLALGLIRFYQACLSPVFPSACRFYPSCSAYAFEAVEKWGVRAGTRLALARLLRCRPWGPFGCDPVPEEQGLGAKPEVSGSSEL